MFCVSGHVSLQLIGDEYDRSQETLFQSEDSMGNTFTAVIFIHAVCASFAILFGAFQLLRKTKGGKLHKVIGRLWVLCMYVVTISSFAIQNLNGGFSWLHALSIFTFITVTVGIVAAVRHNIKAHKGFMTGSYFGILGATIGVIAVPTRRIPQLAVHEPLLLFFWASVIVAMTAFVIVGSHHLINHRKQDS